MKTKEYHWFPLYADKWIVGTRYLTLQQQGIYLQLLLLQFKKGPFTVEQATRATMPSSESEHGDMDFVLDDKFEYADGKYCNQRMEEVREEQQEKSQKRLENMEKARERKARSRHKMQTNATTNASQGGHGDNRVTHSTEIEIEKEIEKELEIDTTALVATLKQRWNEAAERHEAIRPISEVTKKRRREFLTAVKNHNGFYAKWKVAVDKLPIPNTERFTFQPSFDWMLKYDNVVKVFEGAYENAKQPTKEEQISKRVDGFLQGD